MASITSASLRLLLMASITSASLRLLGLCRRLPGGRSAATNIEPADQDVVR